MEKCPGETAGRSVTPGTQGTRGGGGGAGPIIPPEPSAPRHPGPQGTGFRPRAGPSKLRAPPSLGGPSARPLAAPPGGCGLRAPCARALTARLGSQRVPGVRARVPGAPSSRWPLRHRSEEVPSLCGAPRGLPLSHNGQVHRVGGRGSRGEAREHVQRPFQGGRREFGNRRVSSWCKQLTAHNPVQLWIRLSSLWGFKGRVCLWESEEERG